jgi:hypothetical protein
MTNKQQWMRNVMFSFSLRFALLHLRNPPSLSTFHVTSLHYLMISPTHSLRLIYHFPNPFPKITWFTGESPWSICRQLFQIQVLFANEYFPISVRCFLLLIFLSWSPLLTYTPPSSFSCVCFEESAYAYGFEYHSGYGCLVFVCVCALSMFVYR